MPRIARNGGLFRAMPVIGSIPPQYLAWPLQTRGVTGPSRHAGRSDSNVLEREEER